MRKEVANNDDVSDVDDVDLECRWRSTHRSADRSHREAAAKVSTCLACTRARNEALGHCSRHHHRNDRPGVRRYGVAIRLLRAAVSSRDPSPAATLSNGNERSCVRSAAFDCTEGEATAKYPVRDRAHQRICC